MNKRLLTATLSLLSVGFSALTLAPKVNAVVAMYDAPTSTLSTTFSNDSKQSQNVVKSSKSQLLADAVSCYEDNNRRVCCYVDDDGNSICEEVTVN